MHSQKDNNEDNLGTCRSYPSFSSLYNPNAAENIDIAVQRLNSPLMFTGIPEYLDTI